MSERETGSLRDQGRGSLEDSFGEYEGTRIFVRGTQKDAKWVVAETTSLESKLGSAECRGMLPNYGGSRRMLKEVREGGVSKKAQNIVFVVRTRHELRDSLR